MKIEILIFIGIIFLIVILIPIYFLIKDSGTECLADPLKYAVDSYNLRCTCTVPDHLPFIIDKDGMQPIRELVPESESYEKLNLSKITIINQTS